MSQPKPQEDYPKGVIYPITVHGMKGAMEDLAATQRRAEESEKREQELQREFIDLRNRAELAEKSALDLKAIADHLQRQRAADNDAHGKDIADLQERLKFAQSELTAIKKGWAKPIDIQTLTEQRDSYRSELERINTLCAELTQQRDDWMRRSEEYKDEAITENAEKGIQELLKNRALEKIAELTRQRDAFKVEYESRAIWIEKMNAILGCDNSDGFHSSPSPHEIAQQMKHDLAHAFNLPGDGKHSLNNDPQAPPRAELEDQLDSLERDNDRLRAVIDGIKSSIDGIQTLVTLSE